MIIDPADRDRRSASGVRRGGDHFQDIFVWQAAMELLRPTSPFVEVQFEAADAGNVDDVVLIATDRRNSRYAQVKWSTRLGQTVSETYLFTHRGGGTSLLQKLHASYVRLSRDGVAPQMRLVTNRALDPDDPLLRAADGNTGLLNPAARAAPSGSAVAHEVTRWAEHVGVDRSDLLDVLDHLVFEPARHTTTEVRNAKMLMYGAGLEDSDAALDAGLTAVRDWIINGVRARSRDDIERLVDEAGLRRAGPSVVLSVAAIDTDPHADLADHHLNWVDHYDTTVPVRLRTVPTNPGSWQRMSDGLDAVARAIEIGEPRSVMVRGALRQATFFAVGAALPLTRGFTLSYRQQHQTWTTDAAKQASAVAVAHIDLGDGDDLAVVAAVSADATSEVVQHFRGHAGHGVGRIIVISPEPGTGDQAVGNAGQAVALAESIRNTARDALAEQPNTERIHLFLAGPGGLALLLGHRWNKLRPTTVYEHLGAGRGYQPAFTIDA